MRQNLERLAEIREEHEDQIKKIREPYENKIARIRTKQKATFMKELCENFKVMVAELYEVLEEDKFERTFMTKYDNALKSQSQQEFFHLFQKILYPKIRAMLYKGEKQRQEKIEHMNKIIELKRSLKEQAEDTEVRLRDIEKQGKMSDHHFTIFHSAWTSLYERFDLVQMEKFAEKAKNEAGQWIKKRLMRSLEGQPLDQNFVKLYQFQIQVLNQLYLFQQEQTQQLREKEKAHKQAEMLATELKKESIDV